MTEFEQLVAEWLEGRRWIRCSRCGEVREHDEPGAPGYDLAAEVDGGELVGIELTCDPCLEAAS